MFNCPVCGAEFESELAYRMNNGCDNCWWEEDSLQEYDHDYKGGANSLSLSQFREKWLSKSKPVTA